jgi:hypothetical protein
LLFGISLSTYTAMHVAISLIAIAAGVVVLLRPSRAPRALGITTLFLVATLASSVTGLLYLTLFPRFGMGHAIAVASLVVFVPTLLALWGHRLAGRWRQTWVIGATTLLYLNAFIAVMQAFGKMVFLLSLEPTLVSPLLLAHLLLVTVCVWLGLHAYAGLQPGPKRAKPRRVKPLRVADRWG